MFERHFLKIVFRINYGSIVWLLRNAQVYRACPFILTKKATGEVAYLFRYVKATNQ